MVLACAGTLVRLVEVGPIYVVVGTCPDLCLGGSLMQIHIASLMVLDWLCYLLVNNVKLIGVHGVSCGGAVEMYGGGALKCSLTLSPRDLPDSPM